MKKYRFQLEKEEIREYCFKAVWEALRPSYVRLLVILVILVCECLLMPLVGAMLIIFMLLVFGVYIGRNYSILNKALSGKTHVIWIEDGMLKLDKEGELYSEISCESITVFRVTKRLLMLGCYQSKKKIGWYLIPLRVFGDNQERDQFMEAMKNPRTQEGLEIWSVDVAESCSTGDPEVQKEQESEYFHFSFQVGEEEWIEMYSGAVEILRSGILGEKNKGRLVQMIVPALFVIIPCLAVWWFPNAALSTYSALFVGIFIFLSRLQNMKEDPRKKLRAQVRRGSVQNNDYGNWEIFVTDTGIRQIRQGKNNTIMPWESLLCMVETEEGLFFYQKDKRHFTMIPGGCVESREQTDLLKGLCRERQITVFVAEKMKYMPKWIFSTVKIAVIGVYFAACIWLVFRDSGSSIYSDYVPLDEQVSVLRSLGFEVPQKIEEELRDYMEEYNMSVYVEEYPYTWLLSNLAISVYSEKEEYGSDGIDILWFDFEGWDISTDYIMVLEGMQKLASGSIIDGVENIHENTDDANWERGTGKITVLLEWNGQEYSWRMDMKNDWIDEEVLGIYNGLLQKEDVPERFYVTGDNGQGALVFFCDQEWAAKFEKATGLELEAYTVKKGW